MNAITHAWTALKAFTLRFGTRTSRLFGGLLPRTRIDYAREVGDGRSNSVVMACVLWMSRTFPEAPLRVSRRDRDGTWNAIPDHPLTQLVERPNPYYSGVLLWMATLSDWLLTGNAYWLKARSGAGRTVQLWWVPSALMEPGFPDDGSQYLTHYTYTPDSTREGQRLEVGDVVHFRYGFDPRNLRKGMSPLASLFREIFTDDEASNFSAALLGNLGVPGVVISPGDDASMSQEDVEAVKARYQQSFGGDRRGSALVLGSKTQVSVLSFSPEQMNLRDLRKIPEERVSAIFGVPAVVAGLGAGLDRSTFANYAEAREAAYESNIIPTQRLLAAEIQIQLLPDFGDTAQLRVDFDLSAVRVLQEDQDALHQRLREDLKAGGITLNMFLSGIGQEPLPNGDVLYLPNTITVTDPAESLIAEPPEPVLPPGDEEMDEDDRPQIRALPAPPARKSAHDVPADMDRLRRTLERRMGRALAAFLEGQAERVSAAVGRRKAIRDAAPGPDDLLTPEEEARLRALLQRWHQRTLDSVQEMVEDALGIAFDLDDLTTRAYLGEAGSQIVAIHETTRQAVRDALVAGQAEGENLAQLAKRLRTLPAFNRERALLVARTELAQASNLAALTSYRASGIVAGVEVLDGDYDAVCPAANGTRLSLRDAQGYPRLAHPNCRRAFSPITDAAELEAAA